MTHINPAAQLVYSEGVDPLDWAIELAYLQIDAHETVWTARADNADAYPLYVLPDDPMAVARAIIGRLLDAGWTPPAVKP